MDGLNLSRAAGEGNGRDGRSRGSRVRAARAGVDAAAWHGALTSTPPQSTLSTAYTRNVEGHFVHTNAQGAKAVVSVFYRIWHRPNALLEQMLRNAPNTSSATGSPVGEANPAAPLSDLD